MRPLFLCEIHPLLSPCPDREREQGACCCCPWLQQSSLQKKIRIQLRR
jgi:hypothetical protein